METKSDYIDFDVHFLIHLSFLLLVVLLDRDSDAFGSLISCERRKMSLLKRKGLNVRRAEKRT